MRGGVGGGGWFWLEVASVLRSLVCLCGLRYVFGDFLCIMLHFGCGVGQGFLAGLGCTEVHVK